MGNEVKKMSLVGIVGNIVLTLFKLLAGIFGHSNAMISDAVHSMSDVFGTLIAYIGTRISKKEADEKHPYGHERLECVASVILAVVLFITGFFIGYNTINELIEGKVSSHPGIIAIIAAIVSIVVKEAMFWYTRFYAKKINSAVFMADAWHHRTDAISSVGALVGIIGTMMGVVWLDDVACIIISAFIIYISIKIFIEAIDKMVDKACPKEFEDELKEFALETDGIERIDMIQTRVFGEKIYIDLEIACDGNLSLHEAHLIAENLHSKVENKYKQIKHIMIHVNPTE